MTPEGWQRIEAIVGGALERAATERSSYLDQVCGGDQTLRMEVESLLSFDGEAGQVVAGAVEGAAALFQSDDVGLAEGDRIGVYRVIREIGRGGMGTVYLAERDDEEFRKQVAIKLVTRGLDTADLLRRFRHERQILARLDHPYIARLLDGGSTGDGRPFLVMEYVEGTRITGWCADRMLAARERIELFRKVCAAVQSAHQNLVVHRDLKPGNILVDAEGSPKLLDFGIAKLLDPDDAPEFTLSAGGVQMLTPDYASPEQVLSGPITTATDVYSLGVILYELLAGVRPHRLQNYSTSEIERVVCEQDPEKPSTARRLAAARGETPKAPPLKAGDLDNIVLKAMQKEPARRYGSATELSEDLRRYLEGLPVQAREDTLRYRARKFIRRHRAGVAAAVLLVATLAGGITVSAVEARRAERRFSEVRRIAHAVLYDIHDAIRDQGSVKAREIVVKTALEYLDGLARESAGDPSIQLELAQAYERVGDVQGNATQSSLGRTEDALESYRKSMRIADALANSRAASGKANLIRMRLRERTGDISVARGNIAGAMELFRQGEEIGETIALGDAANIEILTALSSLYLANARGDVDSARSMTPARKGIAIAERVAAAQPGNEEALFALSDGHSMLGITLRRRNRLAEALDELRKAAQLREALVAARPLNIRYQHDLMISYSKLGDLLGPINPSLMDGPAALENYRKALALAERLSTADPADKGAAFDHGMALLTTGFAIQADRDHAPAALALLRQALAAFEALAQADPASARLQSSIAIAHQYIALRLTGAGDTAAALRSDREAIRIAQALIARDARNLTAQRIICANGQEAAKTLAAGGQRTEALDFSRRAIAAAEAARAIDGANAIVQALLPRAYATAGSVLATLASGAGSPATQRLEDWNQARAWFEKSANAWELIQPQGGWPRDRDAQLTLAKAEVSRCAAASARVR
jgi:serine/threonine protein kinase